MEEQKEIMPWDKAYPTVAQGWGVLLLFVASTIVVGIPFSIFEFFHIESGLIKFLGYSLPVILTIWFTSIWRKKNTRNRKGFAWGTFPIGIVLPLVLLTLAMAVLLEGAIGWVPMPEWVLEIFKNAVPRNYWGFLTVAVAAPVLEEVLMRGVVLDGMLRNYEPRKAILWSAVLFGVLHMNPWQFVAAFAIGIVLGWLYWKTNSLWPGILVHFVNNATAFVGMVYFPDAEGNFTYDLVGSPWLYALLLVFCAGIVYSCYRYIQFVLNKREAIALSR